MSLNDDFYKKQMLSTNKIFLRKCYLETELSLAQELKLE